jgi:hypothetical protein
MFVVICYSSNEKLIHLLRGQVGILVLDFFFFFF